MSEAELQAAVIECAQLLGWKCAHFRPAMTSKGWRTPVSADGAGWPDLTLQRTIGERKRLIFAELKTEKGKTSAAQDEWLEALEHTDDENDGGECYVWRPSMWLSGEIESILR